MKQIIYRNQLSESKTAFSNLANIQLARLFHLTEPDSIKFRNHTFDSRDKYKNIYELKTTTHKEYYLKYKRNPLILLNKTKKDNIIYLDFILVGFFDLDKNKITHAFLYNMHNKLIEKEM